MKIDGIMGLAQISIKREGYISATYGAAKLDKPLVTIVEVVGKSGKMELTLSPEVGERLVAIIAEELAAEAKRVAEAMTADFLTVAAAPQLTTEALVEG